MSSLHSYILKGDFLPKNGIYSLLVGFLFWMVGFCLGVAFFIDLPAATDSHTVTWYIMGDARAGGGQCIVSDFKRRNKS